MARKINYEYIDKWVKEWQDSNSDLSLREYLGLSHEEFSTYVKSRNNSDNTKRKKYTDKVDHKYLDMWADSKVIEWHESDSKLSLQEYLGMTNDEYNSWLMGETVPRSLLNKYMDDVTKRLYAQPDTIAEEDLIEAHVAPGLIIAKHTVSEEDYDRICELWCESVERELERKATAAALVIQKEALFGGESKIGKAAFDAVNKIGEKTFGFEMELLKEPVYGYGELVMTDRADGVMRWCVDCKIDGQNRLVVVDRLSVGDKELEVGQRVMFELMTTVYTGEGAMKESHYAWLVNIGPKEMRESLSQERGAMEFDASSRYKSKEISNNRYLYFEVHHKKVHGEMREIYGNAFWLPSMPMEVNSQGFWVYRNIKDQDSKYIDQYWVDLHIYVLGFDSGIDAFLYKNSNGDILS